MVRDLGGSGFRVSDSGFRVIWMARLIGVGSLGRVYGFPKFRVALTGGDRCYREVYRDI